MRQVTIVGVLLLVVMVMGAPGTLSAQGPDDWAEPYQAGMLPGYVGDMAAYESAPRYDIDMALSFNEYGDAIITGHQVVRYTNRTEAALPDVVFRLYPNLESFGGVMMVENVLVDGIAVEPSLDDTSSVLTVLLPIPLEPGASVTFDMDFGVQVYRNVVELYAQFSYLGDVLALPNAYPVLSVYEPGAGWWQVTDHPQGDAVFSQTAFYTVDITAPEDLVVVASGVEVETVGNGDGTLTHVYVAPLMRDFAIMSSAEYTVLSGEQDGVTINVYYLAEDDPDGATAQVGLEMTQDAVRIFNAAYGVYPFAELDVVQTPTDAGGIEYPGLFVVASDYWNRNDSFFEVVIVHEAAHQWWYSLVGNDQTLEPWIDEALAQYSVAVYHRALEGEAAFEAVMANYATQYARYTPAPDESPVIGEPVTAYSRNAYYYVVYQRGPLFYGALVDEYGYEQVELMLQDLFAGYRYDYLETGDVLASFETTLGDDLDDFFAEWVGEFPVG
ncbi:MAG: M1 family metallopeptidase [Chloroflexi bacterium]|nr:M1 family metallopeptidase [Chloroflexota bacterium]